MNAELTLERVPGFCSSKPNWEPAALAIGLPFYAASGVAGHLGGVAWPYVLSPQQTTRSSVRMAQVSSTPALIALKVPGGGEDCP